MTARARSFVLLLVAFAATAAAQPTSTPRGLADQVDEVIDASAFSDAYWGVHIVDLDTDQVLVDRNGGKRFISSPPAT